MLIRFANGARVNGITFDPSRRVRAAFWTHRPARRAGAHTIIASDALAADWSNVLGVPYGRSVVAAGLRLELLPSGYGPGGSAVLCTEQGERTLVVGPTTEALDCRLAERLVLHAGCPGDAVECCATRIEQAAHAPIIVVPDGGAAAALSEHLTDRGIPHRRPRWLGPSDSMPRATISTRARGNPAEIHADVRPQATEEWLVDYALGVEAEMVFVHGPRAEQVALKLAERGTDARVLHAPTQLPLRLGE